MEKLRSGGHIENFETVLLKKNGARIDISLSASPIKDLGGQVIAVATIARDITERKRSEQELHRLTARLLNLQDDERRRLALELHDVTAQNLFAINMNLSRLQRGRVEPVEFQELLAESRKLGHQSLQEIRTLSYLLHPPMLEQAGLVDALKWYVGGFIKRSGINVEIHTIREIGRLPAEIEMAFFRIVQESLTNIRRHSGSNSANIRLEKTRDQIILQVSDQGHGMDSKINSAVPHAGESLGVGLPGMRQRLQQLGGSLIIESSDRGVVVTAIVPITKGDGHATHLVS
jgi:two-component system NarL family sensor kinase